MKYDKGFSIFDTYKKIDAKDIPKYNKVAAYFL